MKVDITYCATVASIIVQVNDTVRLPSRQTDLDKRSIFSPSRGVQATTGSSGNKELPVDRQTEDVEPVVTDEVLHLTLTVRSSVRKERNNRSRGIVVAVLINTEIYTRNIDTCEANLSRLSRWWDIA